jgi:hypothetical protein
LSWVFKGVPSFLSGAGCRDYAALLAVPAALDFWRTAGQGRVLAWQRSLLQGAVAHLSQAWGTQPLAPLALCAAMALVRLPAALAAGSAATSADAKHVQASASGRQRGVLAARMLLRRRLGCCKALERPPPPRAPAASTPAPPNHSHTHASARPPRPPQDALHWEHGVEAPVKALGGQLYVRISAHVYNEPGDYEALGRAVLSLAEQAAAASGPGD